MFRNFIKVLEFCFQPGLDRVLYLQRGFHWMSSAQFCCKNLPCTDICILLLSIHVLARKCTGKNCNFSSKEAFSDDWDDKKWYHKRNFTCYCKHCHLLIQKNLNWNSRVKSKLHYWIDCIVCTYKSRTVFGKGIREMWKLWPFYCLMAFDVKSIFYLTGFQMAFVSMNEGWKEVIRGLGLVALINVIMGDIHIKRQKSR